ncbi:uncharacterized protein LOC121731248 isoform X2 [Aricia agestis]|uniref:uncharacterized protein LOC121731248 isoform X2 n=1 Tax=Aricia agestis TaxID=91739 RepID=UPI001C206925|nr:uncharacterized protein LOC121731248 isoform X2 [Aricia agestis]
MAKLFFYAVILACFSALIGARPSSNEATGTEETPNLETVANADSEKEQRSITYLIDEEKDSDAYKKLDIVEKIRTINDNLKKPQRQQNIYYKTNFNDDYVMDNEILEKIKHLIATNKYNTKIKVNDQQESEDVLENTEEHLKEPEENRETYTRDLKFVPNLNNPAPVQIAHIPYTVNVPVFILSASNQVPQYYGADSNVQNNNNPNFAYLRQSQPTSGFPSFSLPSFQNFQIPSPFASFFPVLVKDPIVAFLQGGGWSNFFEYGQSADVCSRKQKAAVVPENDDSEIIQNIMQQIQSSQNTENETINNESSDRESRAMRRHVAHDTSYQQADKEKSKTIYYTKRKPAKKISSKRPVKVQTEKPVPVTDVREEEVDEDVRTPFGDFTFFGNRKPIAPSPGFFINRLRVKKGGVAIAGPGGVATAGNGGTAIVGADSTNQSQ